MPQPKQKALPVKTNFGKEMTKSFIKHIYRSILCTFTIKEISEGHSRISNYQILKRGNLELQE